MSKKYIFLCLIAFVTLSFNGCIIDAFDTLTQELPYTVPVRISGSDNQVEQSVTVNLDDNDFYQENRDKINHIQLVKIAYKTKSVVPGNLQGEITLTVKQSNGVVLFSKNIPGAQPSAYFVNPYELSLTQSEIQLVNAYLSILSNRTFTATVTVTNITPTGNKTIEAEVFAVFQMDYDL